MVSPTMSAGDEESFALLHFYHNCSAHKDLIRFLPEKSWVEISQSTRETKLVKERHEQEGFFYCELDKGYWVNLPEAIARRERNEHDSRLLLDVLHQLMNFVTKTASKLLCSSLLLPSARVLLREHFAGCRMETKFKPAAGIIEGRGNSNYRARRSLHSYHSRSGQKRHLTQPSIHLSHSAQCSTHLPVQVLDKRIRKHIAC